MVPNLLVWIYWDPPREAFRLPYLNHPIVWYGICFAFGFLLSYICLYILFSDLIRQKGHDKITPVPHQTRVLLDSLAWFIVIGTIAGARLGQAIFYEWPYYYAHPLAIFRIWEGGWQVTGQQLAF